ncbi:RNA-binding protein musashi/mRNA cleavage and polyadenylation factor I complex, subunit HRP1 [Handroanthus impetiginosus]|uniref:RNA-binding protein musashi/mRNA cleavage and polyadenylation factor I complex, subunit HRP1 n=1 Tax=Handroanthus impetiginosus TaxID=429701 RepID=A0A2G9HMS5_9LAMI|nr:RNA-binding protein musashi/mRNA cleavage and polyadenylation factor I complex, subunit HRP1 [Handroanthus impetiginosus]
MDLTKKRKADENGRTYPLTTDLGNTMAAAPPAPIGILSPEDAEKILEPFTKEQLLPILRAAVLRHPDVLEAVRTVADADPVQRKLFVRGLGWETTTEKLRQVFSAYGELDEANTIVITDKNSGKSKGYGFVTFKHIDAAILALKEPNKKIDGRITVTQLAAAGNSGNAHSSDVALRKIYVGNIPFEISSERLLAHFSMYGEIEEGPLGFDKQTGKAKGFAFFVYKTEEGAKASLVDPMKTIDGHQVVCKMATDNKKQKPNVGPPGGMVPGMPNSAPMGMPGPNYGMGGYMGYGPGPNMPQPPQQTGMIHQNASFNTAIGGPGGPGGQGYGGGYGGGAPLYDGVGGAGPGEYGGGLGNAGGYRMPPSSIGMQSSGGYPDGGNYGIPTPYPSQQNHPGAGPTGPGPRLPAYQGMPPY